MTEAVLQVEAPFHCGTHTFHTGSHRSLEPLLMSCSDPQTSHHTSHTTSHLCRSSTLYADLYCFTQSCIPARGRTRCETGVNRV